MNKEEFKIDFVGVGVMKSATTWIAECLGEHPEIFLTPKDQKRFARFLKEERSHKFLKRYKEYFLKSKKNQLKGEFHVTYLTNKKIANRIYKNNPRAKIIVSLRNPIERAASNLKYNYFVNGRNNKKINDLMKEKNIIEKGFYYKQLKPYFDLFPKENILVLIYEDIKGNERKFISKIYKFLGVKDNFISSALNYKVNQSSFKNTKSGEFLHKKIIKPLLRKTKWAWRLKNSSFIKKIYYLLINFIPKEKKYKMDKVTKKKLQEIYKEDIKNLEKLINRNLNFWK